MANPKIEKRKAVNIAYIAHRGCYGEIPWDDYMHRLFTWAKEQKVMPGFYPIGIYHDDPETTPPEDCRSEIAITFKGDGDPASGIEIRKMPEMEVATMSHKGPISEYRDTYAKLAGWISERGYGISGPSIEVYSRKPEVVNDLFILYAKIMMPVERR